MRSTLFAAAVAALLAGPALAQDATADVTLDDRDPLGDPSAGRSLAEDVCASCHAVDAEATPDAEVPSFQSIADTPGMTSRALTVWLTTFHPERTMPAINLTQDEREDVIAYILSLAEE